MFIVSREADRVQGYRFDASIWRNDLAPDTSAARTGRKAGFEFCPLSDCFSA
jgi:3-oxoacyl-[acyl-carrier protein] reductase